MEITLGHIYRWHASTIMQKQLKNINISIDNMQIERVHSFNFLGILLDETLLWKKHAIMIANKISRVTGILHRLNNISPIEILLT